MLKFLFEQTFREVQLRKDLPGVSAGNLHFTLSPRCQCRVDAGWPWKLQMVALHGWMLARMSPCDLDAFLEGATATVGTCNRLTGSMLLHLWAMAFFKWPECVTQWASVVSDAAGRPGVSAGSLDVQAEFFASKSVELACHCDMDDMPWMHEQISVGLQNVLFGPVFWLDK